ncbi:hypothetical protein CIK75_02885 [Glutamicibacter sp. BW78]|nr:hypothetical protein CIK75_02885 [Glutamicibacter sp. BW78]
MYTKSPRKCLVCDGMQDTKSRQLRCLEIWDSVYLEAKVHKLVVSWRSQTQLREAAKHIDALQPPA